MSPEEKIFETAAALPEAERAAFLEKACAGQADLRDRVEALLRSNDVPGFMQECGRFAALSESGVIAPALVELSGERIGRYRLLQQIGEGGFGVVWMADQVEPVTRRVALKIIKAGMDTKEVIARFEAERQALAMMDHPNIAKVFDAGATDKGRPYLVMELVEGIPITKFCDEREFHTRQRLEIFTDVCSAINHAHQKGVIHRDIKPTNVMVTLNGDRPVVKVIDFGIAKATQGRLTDRTLFTRFEQFIGTPAYMSPEQAAISEIDIDTRSDIYSLGVLLYEMLTGAPPFDAKSLLSAGYEEMRRIIREVEPPRPSARLSTVAGEERAAIARSRHSAPEKLSRLVEPELDWIVMKAIEKDRARRYETANSLALDIQRHLTNQPVTAAAPGVVYLFRKFARRHKAALGLAALITVMLVTATGISLWQADIAWEATKAVNARNTEYREMLAEAARSDRLVAEEKLQAGKDREALAYLARACEYEPQSTFPAEKAVAALNGSSHPPPAVIITGHERAVWSAQFSPDGTRVVTASEDKTARVWDARSGNLLATLTGHEEPVKDAQFSPDGTILTVSKDRTARVWGARSGELLVTLAGHEESVEKAQFSPDGTSIVTASKDRTARVWEARSGKLLATLTGHDGAIWDAQFSRDGTRIVIASGRTAEVWEARSGKLLAILAGHNDAVWNAQFSPDGTRIVTASKDGTAKVWEAGSGKLLHTLTGHESPVRHAQFSPDGALIVTAERNGLAQAARVWEAQSGKLLASLTGHVRPVENLQFSPDSTRVVTASLDHTARVWDARSGKLLATLARHEGDVQNAHFSPDGTRIVTASLDRTALVWDDRSGKLLVTLAGHGGKVFDAQFSPDGTRVVTAAGYKTARVWEASNGKLLATLASHEGWVYSAQFSPDGSRVVTASDDLTARIWEAKSGKLLATLAGHEKMVRDAQFSPDGTCIVTASDDRTARVWEAASGRLLATLAGHEGWVLTAQFSADGTRVVTGDDRTGRVWETRSGSLLATLAGHQSLVMKAQFSPDGARVVTASYDKTARVWEARSGRLLATLAGHRGLVVNAQFSPDGTHIVTTSYDQTARVWESVNGILLATLAGHQDVVWKAEFNQDGTRIVTASNDRTARVWEAWSGKLLTALAGHEGEVYKAHFSPDGTSIVTASDDQTARLWHLLPPSAGAPPEWFADFLRCLAQMRLNSDGELEPLKMADWLALRERLREVVRASAGQDTPYLRILRRYVTE